MNKNELIENLLAFDEEASLLSVSQNIKYQCYIVGGGALLLLDLIPRATYDIDVIRCTGEHLVSIMADYDINMNVSAYLTYFADGYQSRAKKIDLETTTVDFYTLSVEDLIISKIASGRTKDMEDIRRESVVNIIDWNKLDNLAKITVEGILSDYDKNEFIYFYKEYRKEFFH